MQYPRSLPIPGFLGLVWFDASDVVGTAGHERLDQVIGLKIQSLLRLSFGHMPNRFLTKRMFERVSLCNKNDRMSLVFTSFFLPLFLPIMTVHHWWREREKRRKCAKLASRLCCPHLVLVVSVFSDTDNPPMDANAPSYFLPTYYLAFFFL